VGHSLQRPGVEKNHEIHMVDVAGIEPATPCLQRLNASRINNLHGVSPSDRMATERSDFLTLRAYANTQQLSVRLPVFRGRDAV
jgi:hypothetical protein